MSEQEEIKENKEEEVKEDSTGRDNSESMDIIDRSNEASERMERANKRKDELITREEKLQVQKQLGGGSEGGTAPVRKKVETPDEKYNREAKERYVELTRQDWERSKNDNEQLIIANKMQIEMATEVIKLCDKRIKEFPKEEQTFK